MVSEERYQDRNLSGIPIIVILNLIKSIILLGKEISYQLEFDDQKVAKKNFVNLCDRFILLNEHLRVLKQETFPFFENILPQEIAETENIYKAFGEKLIISFQKDDHQNLNNLLTNGLPFVMNKWFKIIKVVMDEELKALS